MSILLFTCNYGHGHKMATQGIGDALDEYCVEVIDIYDGPLGSIDPMRSIYPELSAESMYNQMMRSELNTLLNFAGKVVPKALVFREEKLVDLLKNYLSDRKVDVIICCVPLINAMLYQAAKAFNIPLIVVTTDIDIWTFCVGFKPPLDPSYPLVLTVAYDKRDWDPLYLESVPHCLRHALRYDFGYPLRREFSDTFSVKELERIRVHFSIEKGDVLIILMIGGNSGKSVWEYAQLMASLTSEEVACLLEREQGSKRLHLLALCGDFTKKGNQELAQKIDVLNQHASKSTPSLFLQARENTPEIAALLSLQELLCVVSKPGGSSVNELIKKRVPQILHISGVPLSWEQGNLKYVVLKGLGFPFVGERLKSLKKKLEFLSLINQSFLLRNSLRKSNSELSKVSYLFQDKLVALVKEFLGADTIS